MTSLKKNRGRMSRRRISLFIIIGICIITLLVGELLARTFLTSPSNKIFDPELGFTYQPDTTIFQTREGWQVNQVNSLGLVDREHVFTPERDILVILGDSYSEALHVPFNERFTTLLDHFLTDYEVVNAARTGLHPASFTVVTRRLAKKIPIHRLLLVVSPGDSNDILAQGLSIETSRYGSSHMRLKTNKKLQEMRKWVEPFVHRSALAKHLVQKYLPDVKYFYVKVVNLLARFKRQGQVGMAENTQDTKDQFVAYVLDIAFSELKEIAPFDVLFIPNYEYRGRDSIAESRKSQQWEEVMRNTASRYGARFISAGADLSSNYRQFQQPLTGFSNSGLFRGHFNTHGHAVLAQSAMKLFTSPQATSVITDNQ